MGAGKTTVVGPLLSLILADGQNLIMHVMPTPLLDQSKNVLRSRFSSIIQKRIYTLDFERGCQDNYQVIEKIIKKLRSAQQRKDIICSSPEAVKSILLKFIEQLYFIESSDTPTITKKIEGSERLIQESNQFSSQLVSKSKMSDAIIEIFDIWKKTVLIMDEVDVLLHPLKSELNFPIGPKQAIDLAGYRWDLPIFLIDCVLSHARGNLCDDIILFQQAEKVLNLKVNDILASLKKELSKAQFTVQKIPHLVLLDPRFYVTSLRPLIAQLCLLWLFTKFEEKSQATKPSVLLEFLEGKNVEAHTAVIEASLKPDEIKLLNLGASWVTSFLPHSISKINRVSYGILSPEYVTKADPMSPLGRLFMAIPFVGKDVPSASSEFAHPDIAIGLTILAYRYEGLRLEDVKKVIIQLKQDHGRQVGPQEQRTASVLFSKWLELSKQQKSTSKFLSNILPLSLFDPSESKQICSLHAVISKLPEAVFYYLRQYVFPTCMNFQKLKISACGHDLGSEILFKTRVGFSGTPSNLLPIDLGSCQYEPGSDGQIINTLTSSEIVNYSLVEKGWNAKALLRKIATSDPPFHALIDTGALITGMENIEAAKYLLKYLPVWFDGVVYFDKNNYRNILLRASGHSILLEQCGVSPDRRFTLYDQIHTTGIDIKQAPRARAALTLGKDMTFRDYAQGAYRMRGIGIGQTIHLFIIPEVKNLMKNQLSMKKLHSKSERPENYLVDTISWLLVNSMTIETLQSVKLSVQELNNLWRKKAVAPLIEEVKQNGTLHSELDRIHRFTLHPKQAWLRKCLNEFNEPIDFVVPNTVPKHENLLQKIQKNIKDHSDFVASSPEMCQSITSQIVQRVSIIASAKDYVESDDRQDSEVVHENEQENQQEVEQETEQEEEKISVYARDNEQPNPWNVDVLTRKPTFKEPFYKLSAFQVSKRQPKLKVSDEFLFSDNLWRPRWAEMGQRRLKNIALVLEWCSGPVPTADNHFIVALSLAEGETVRRIIHSTQPILQNCVLALYSVQAGTLLDASVNYPKKKGENPNTLVSTGIQLFRFVNNEMYYTEQELDLLANGLAKTLIADRKLFFSECQNLRRRERNLWEDTPVSKIFTAQEKWHLLNAQASLQHVVDTIHNAMKSRVQVFNPYLFFNRYDLDRDGVVNSDELQAIFTAMKLKGLTATDFQEATKLIEKNAQGMITRESFRKALDLPTEPELLKNLHQKQEKYVRAISNWTCEICTFSNPPKMKMCSACGWGADAAFNVFQAGPDPTQWVCAADKGGCTAYNPNTEFYCVVCMRARPSTANMSF